MSVHSQVNHGFIILDNTRRDASRGCTRVASRDLASSPLPNSLQTERLIVLVLLISCTAQNLKMVSYVSMWHSCIFVLVWQARMLESSLPRRERCPKLLKKFADVVSNYTHCAVSNSRPFRFCCVCEGAYVTALNGHRDIVEDTGCHKDLVMAEKYQIVEAAYDFAVNLWKSSNCPGMKG